MVEVLGDVALGGARCDAKLLEGSMNRYVSTAVSRSLAPGTTGRALVNGSAPRSGYCCRSWFTDTASSTEAACVKTDIPFGSRWTTAVRLDSGKPNSVTDRASACRAGLFNGMMLASWSPPAPSDGAKALSSAVTKSHPASSSQRPRVMVRV
jgi:hypothetical protein